MPDRPYSLDHPEDLLYLIAGIAFAGLFLFFGGYDALQDRWTEYQASQLSPHYGDQIVFTEFQMDRIRSDTTGANEFELAYCGHFDGQNVVSLRIADIQTAGPTDIVYYCKSYEELSIHTHPNGYAILSDTDKDQLIQNDAAEVVCVYDNNNLNCWTYDEGVEDIVRLEVKS